ncbi:MAG: hypothetical protein KDJ22_04815 [Candidatus Competibacteraceae bacterium]|nr:hypothetical protein [Candidatus Competibacteraceae bacterium]MCP5127252.1 hypothetical protein [Gammaproteobacteria bacterium]
MQIPEHYPPILADIAQLLRLRLNGHFSADQADALALAQVEDLRTVFGGSLVYLPKGQDYERKTRDAALYQEFTGHNHLDLARRYKLTVTQIYDIIARVRAARPSATEDRPIA